MPSPKLIITTEKDATRLLTVGGLNSEVKNSLFVLPIRVHIMRNEEQNFNEKITGYVLKNSRNSILAKGKDDNKSDDSDRAGDRPRTISFRNN
jgi:tetraacyldisaccharide 4'-kinase